MSSIGTGPPYPPPPVADSNAIGSMSIGVKPSAQFTGSIFQNTLTVTAVVFGVLLPGYSLVDNTGDVIPGTTIVKQLTGTAGKIGTYLVSEWSNVSSETIYTQVTSLIDPIGSIPPLNWWDTVISQYANSPRLTQLISNFFQYIDQTANFEAFFDDIWNIDTAQGYGLDVWGRIVGVPRTLEVSAGDYFGFGEAVPGSNPFGQAPFYAGAPLTSNYTLSDSAYRTLILCKALANICDGSIPAINNLLMTLFPGRGNCYVTEGTEIGAFFGFSEAHDPDVTGFGHGTFYSGGTLSPMTMTYTFEFVPTPVELAIIQNSGVLPKPVGVKASVVIL